MSGMLTDYTNNMILDALFGGEPFKPTNILRFGLSKGWANREGKIDEPVGNGYGRVEHWNDTDLFNSAIHATKTNKLKIQFEPPTGCWGLIVSAFIMDYAGNVLAMADLERIRFIDIADVGPSIGVENLLIIHR